MKFWKTITKFGTIPYNGVLLILMLLTAYIRPGNLLHDQYLLSIGIMPLPLKFIIHVCLAILCSYVIGLGIKSLYYKARPIEWTYKNRFQKADASSFPSMHTANTLIMAYYGARMAFVFTDGTTRSLLILGWIMLFLLIASSRIILKNHYLFDVIAGTLFGAAVITVIGLVKGLIYGIF